MANKNYVYMVMLDWSVDEFEKGYDITLFNSYDKADGFYRQLIEKESDPDNSWVGSEALDEDGNPYDDFDLDISDSDSNNKSWDVIDNNDGRRYVYISLKRMEVQ